MVATFGHPPEIDRVKHQPDDDYLQEKRHVRSFLAPAEDAIQPTPGRFRVRFQIRYSNTVVSRSALQQEVP